MGVLITVQEKDNSTGAIVLKFDKNKEVSDFFSAYNTTEGSAFIDGKFYTLVSGSSKQYEDKFLNDIFNIWFNNVSLTTSSFTFEIEIGSLPIKNYPERRIEIDADKTAQYNAEQQKREMDKQAAAAAAAEQEKQRLLSIKQAEQQRAEQAAEQQRVQRDALMEKKQQEMEAKTAFENSDYGKLKNEIKTAFDKWSQKSEFETSTDYDKRIQSQAESQLNKIAVEKINLSKQLFLKEVSAASLQSYDIENENYLVKLARSNDAPVNNFPIQIKVSKNIAESLFTKYGSEKPSNGKPMWAYIVDAEIVNNTWEPSKIIFVFPDFNNENYSKIVNALNESVAVEKSDKVIIEFPSNSSLRSIKLYNIASQYKNKSKQIDEKDSYFYIWSTHNKNAMPLNFSKVADLKE